MSGERSTAYAALEQPPRMKNQGWRAAHDPRQCRGIFVSGNDSPVAVQLSEIERWFCFNQGVALAFKLLKKLIEQCRRRRFSAYAHEIARKGDFHRTANSSDGWFSSFRKSTGESFQQQIEILQMCCHGTKRQYLTEGSTDYFW